MIRTHIRPGLGRQATGSDVLEAHAITKPNHYPETSCPPLAISLEFASCVGEGIGFSFGGQSHAASYGAAARLRRRCDCRRCGRVGQPRLVLGVLETPGRSTSQTAACGNRCAVARGISCLTFGGASTGVLKPVLTAVQIGELVSIFSRLPGNKIADAGRHGR